MTHCGAGSCIVVSMLLNIPMRKYSYRYLTWRLEYGRDWSNASTIHAYDCYCDDGSPHLGSCLQLVALIPSILIYTITRLIYQKFKMEHATSLLKYLQLLSAMTH